MTALPDMSRDWIRELRREGENPYPYAFGLLTATIELHYAGKASLERLFRLTRELNDELDSRRTS